MAIENRKKNFIKYPFKLDLIFYFFRRKQTYLVSEKSKNRINYVSNSSILKYYYLYRQLIFKITIIIFDVNLDK